MVKHREQNWPSVGGAERFVGRRWGGGGVGVSGSESRVRFTGGLGGGSWRMEAAGVLGCRTDSVIGGGGCSVGLRGLGGGGISSLRGWGRVADRYSLKGTETKRGVPFL